MWKIFVRIMATNSGVKAGFWWGVFVILIQWLLAGFWGWRVPPQIPMFYSMPYGEQQLAVSWWFWLLPLSGLLFFGLNVFIVSLSGKTVRVYPQITTWLTLTSLLLITITMVHTLVMVF